MCTAQAISEVSLDYRFTALKISYLDDASWYSVTCFCGQPFAGRPMIECEMCGIWVHMTCAKIKKTKIPEHYNCITCRRDSKAVKTRFRK